MADFEDSILANLSADTPCGLESWEEEDTPCGIPTRIKCELCGRPFCLRHHSAVDPKFCNECLNSKTPALELDESPLTSKDEETGEVTTHVGRSLHPSLGDGENLYKTSIRLVCDMTDDQLEDHIDRFKALVRQAENTLEYRRIQLSVGNLEKEDRKRKRTYLHGVATPNSGTHKISASATTSSSHKSNGKSSVVSDAQAATLAKAMAAAGITPEMLAKMMAGGGKK